MTRIPLTEPWTIAPGDVVLVITGTGIPPGGRADDNERYIRVANVLRLRKRIVGVTSSDGRRYTVHSGARLRYLCEDGHTHDGGVGVRASEVRNV
jgi:hypothetical protein